MKTTQLIVCALSATLTLTGSLVGAVNFTSNNSNKVYTYSSDTTIREYKPNKWEIKKNNRIIGFVLKDSDGHYTGKVLGGIMSTFKTLKEAKDFVIKNG